MKRTPITLALAFAGALSFAALAGAQTDQGGGQSAGGGGGQSTMGAAGQSSGEPSVSSSKASGDQKYLDQVAVGNMAEIQMSQQAVQNAQDPQVKQFAQQMVDQHTQAKEQLQQVASANGVTLPTDLDAKHQKMLSKLQGLNGANFDRQYMKMIVSSHQEMASLLKKRAGKVAGQNASNYGGSNAGTSSTGGSSATGTSGSASGATGTTGTTGTSASSGSENSQVASLAATLLPQVQQHLQEAKDIEKQLSQSGKSSKDNSSKTGK